MEIVDIYGHLVDGSELVLAVGNYNSIHGLACYFPKEDLLQIRPVHEIITPSVLQLILKYEKPSNITSGEKIYFSLSLKENKEKYINVKIEKEKSACAVVSNEKAIFSLDYSSVDKNPRPLLLAGALYSLETVFGEQRYIVSWKIEGFSNGNLAIFLPTTWYEPQAESSFCEMKRGIIDLIENLNQLQFKGYSTQQWCEVAAQVTYCQDNNLCGDCFGQCPNPRHICYPDPASSKFVCGSMEVEPDMTQSTTVSFAETSKPQSNNNLATGIAVIVVFLLVILLFWGLYYRRGVNFRV